MAKYLDEVGLAHYNEKVNAKLNKVNGKIDGADLTPGKQYARVKNGWEEIDVSKDLSEELHINLTTNQASSYNKDLNGATIAIKTPAGTTISSHTWNGTEIVEKINKGIEYEVEVSAIEGYKTPTKQGPYLANQTNRSISFLYETEVVTITLNADNETSCNDQKVTVNNQVHVYNGQFSQKIPFGVQYSVSVDAKLNFMSPSKQTFTANQVSRSVTMTYKYMPLGVYILGTDNNLYTADTWKQANNQAVGIAVLDANTKFIIAPTEDTNTTTWGDTSKTISGIVTTTDSATALKDYVGESNTTKIIEQDSTALAAQRCRNYEFRNGKKGYLPAIGQWQIVYNNKATIDALMTKIGGTALQNNNYWSSTQYSSTSAWRLYWNGGSVNYNSKDYIGCVRAFAAFE